MTTPAPAGKAVEMVGSERSADPADSPHPEVSQPAGTTDPWHITPVRHWGRWVSAVVILAVLGFLVHSVARAAIDWPTVGRYLAAGSVLDGFGHTLLLSALAMIMGVVIGSVVAVMRLSKNRVASSLAWFYVWLFRGTPVLLQLLLWFNLAIVFPTLSFPGLGTARTIDVITPFVAALLGLGVNEGAYLAEAIRSGILSVDEGQDEACAALGLSRWQSLRHVIMPQALRIVLPPLGNESIGMLKTSSLAAVIAYPELLQAVQNIYFDNTRIIELLIVAAIWYLVATSVLTTGQYFLERRLSRGLARVRPPGPAERAIMKGLSRLGTRSRKDTAG